LGDQVSRSISLVKGARSDPPGGSGFVLINGVDRDVGLLVAQGRQSGHRTRHEHSDRMFHPADALAECASRRRETLRLIAITGTEPSHESRGCCGQSAGGPVDQRFPIGGTIRCLRSRSGTQLSVHAKTDIAVRSPHCRLRLLTLVRPGISIVGRRGGGHRHHEHMLVRSRKRIASGDRISRRVGARGRPLCSGSVLLAGARVRLR